MEGVGPLLSQQVELAQHCWSDTVTMSTLNVLKGSLNLHA